MCTAVSLSHENRHFFTRTLDLEYRYEESVTILPRRYPLRFTNSTQIGDHPALLGMAYVKNDYPLYYDAMNEHGLCIAGLAFEGFCTYAPAEGTVGHRIAPWELIPYVLTRCRTVDEAKCSLQDAVLVDLPFCDALPNQPMHWMIANPTACAVLETDGDGRLRIYDDPVGVLTNAPSFLAHLAHLGQYRHLTPHPKLDRDTGRLMRGMGALGLPGDWSSPSRFVHAAFLRRYMRCHTAEEAFSLTDSVKVPRGVSLSADGRPIVTVYSAVMEPQRMAYYFRAEGDSAIRCVRPTALQLRGNTCYSMPL